MPGKVTKQRIINSSIQLFNAKGIANVRLQQIADRTGISIGNLVYHFKNKDAIIEAVCGEITSQANTYLNESREEPSFSDFDKSLEGFYNYMKSYTFFFTDMPELSRTYMLQIHKLRGILGQLIFTVFLFLNHSRNKGLVEEERSENQYRSLAKTIWMLLSFWASHRLFTGKELGPVTEFKTLAWEMIHPFLTDEGFEEYTKIAED